jgi:hypothetical protein
MKKLILLLFLSSCTTQNFNETHLKFNDDLTFDEFNNLLMQYSNQKPYPDIDK